MHLVTTAVVAVLTDVVNDVLVSVEVTVELTLNRNRYWASAGRRLLVL